MKTAAVLIVALPTLLAAGLHIRNHAPLVVNSYLCESAEYAIEFAAAVAHGANEESAKNIVGKGARREVCGRYTGMALIQEQKTVINDGIMYRLIALRFLEDQRVAWLAERVFAVDSHWRGQSL